MKSIRHVFTILFSAYLLGLMVLPCSESHAHAASVTQSGSQDHDGDHDHDMELCTPFCVCGSCVAAIVLHSFPDLYFFDIDSEINRKISNFYQSVNSDFHGSIWQPPRLA